MIPRIFLAALCGALLMPLSSNAAESSLSRLIETSRSLDVAPPEQAPLPSAAKVGQDQEKKSCRNPDATIPPLQAAKGAVIEFHLQVRMQQDPENVLDGMPKGTILRIKLLDPIDSSANCDGDAFQGELASPLLSAQGDVVVPAGAKGEGLFVLLRSRSHPNGFRYELLITKLVDGKKSYDLTASLSPSF